MSSSEHEQNLFNTLIKLNNCKTIVEVGVSQGRTTAVLCGAAKTTGGMVYGFDCWTQHGLRMQFPPHSSKEHVDTYLRSLQHYNFELYNIDTFKERERFTTIIATHCAPIDFCFIDACHSYRGISHDFFVTYPHLSKTGIVAFHDTLRIDGCRQFMLDLRTKYYDGTFDIVDFPFGLGNRRVGISLLVKRSFHTVNIEIDEVCNLSDTNKDIMEQERQYFNQQEELYRSTVQKFTFENE
jgi:hypothetical protein